MKVRMSWADISEESKANVINAIDSGWLSRHKYIPTFEKQIARMHGGKFGVFMNSGTDALRMSLLTLKEIYGWKDGDEVIVPALTFVATANAVLQCGLKVIFADVQKETGNIDPEQIAKYVTSSTRAILPVHLFGLPANMPAIMQVARRHSLCVIEDSCETVGVHEIYGDMACFSFYQSHHIQCGVGGMIVTKNFRYERVARSYMNHGRTDDGTHFEFGRVGYSSRATEMEAGIGIGSAKNFQKNLEKRRALAVEYIERLYEISETEPPIYSKAHSWMFMPITLQSGSRDKLLKYLKTKGIESREAMPLVNQPCYKGMYEKGSCPNAEYWTERGLLLPLHPLMELRHVKYVCESIKRFFK